MSKNKNRKPKIKKNPPKKSIRIGKNNPDSNRSKNPAWQIGLMDLDHKQWGWSRIGKDELKDILSKLTNYESMTWQEIYNASGGKKRGNESHEVDVDKIEKSAQKRLSELKLDDVDKLFSLRLSGKERIWGILEQNVLKIIWYDENHGIDKLKK